jgi:hypothetical protein
MARTTPALRGLCSLVTSVAERWAPEPMQPVRLAGWSHPSRPTVADALAIVRRHVWPAPPVDLAPTKADRVAISCALMTRLTEPLGYAACLDQVELRAYPSKLL